MASTDAPSIPRSAKSSAAASSRRWRSCSPLPLGRHGQKHSAPYVSALPPAAPLSVSAPPAAPRARPRPCTAGRAASGRAGRLAEHALAVAERVEAGLAVVRAHAAVAHAAEGQVGRQMCRSVWLTHAPPELRLLEHVRRRRRRVRRTRTAPAAWARSLTKAMASSSRRRRATGRIGPKISSCMTGAVGVGVDDDRRRDVARSPRRTAPPAATVPAPRVEQAA